MIWPFSLFRRKPEPLDLSVYEGNWVAVKDGKVVASAYNALTMAKILTSSESYKGAKAFFVRLTEKPVETDG